MKQMGQGVQELAHFQKWDDDNNDDDDTHPPRIIVRVGMVFRREQKVLDILPPKQPLQYQSA